MAGTQLGFGAVFSECTNASWGGIKCAALALWPFLTLRAPHELRPALCLSLRRCQRLRILNGCDNCLLRGSGRPTQRANQPASGSRCVGDRQALPLPMFTCRNKCVCVCACARASVSRSPWTTMPASMIHCQACQPKIHSSRLCVATVLACKSKNPASHDCVPTDDKVL